MPKGAPSKDKEWKPSSFAKGNLLVGSDFIQLFGITHDDLPSGRRINRRIYPAKDWDAHAHIPFTTLAKNLRYTFNPELKDKHDVPGHYCIQCGEGSDKMLFLACRDETKHADLHFRWGGADHAFSICPDCWFFEHAAATVPFETKKSKVHIVTHSPTLGNSWSHYDFCSCELSEE